jgi:hypothetical protein
MISKEMNWIKIYESEQEAEEIIVDLYNEQNYKELHIALWTWLSIDGEREKHEWFDAFGIPTIKNDCFACEVAEASFDCLPKWYQEEIIGFGEDCPYFCRCCPLIDKPFGECLDGLYRKWLETYLEDREDLAREIASLEWTVK